jgi:inosose dehydratase
VVPHNCHPMISADRIANAPCSWGVIEGIDVEHAGYDRVLAEMRDAGYAGTELGDWGFMPTDPATLSAALGAHRLGLVGSWVSVGLHDRARHAASVADALRVARQLAASGVPDAVVVLGNDPYADPDRTRVAGRVRAVDGMTDEQWAAFVDGAHAVARRVLDETGIRTTVHPHIATLIETGAEARRLLDSTDPSLVGLCLDTGHWAFGAGEDPVAAVRELRDRVWHVHFKDCMTEVMEQSRREGWSGPEAVARGVFGELGTGAVDFPGMLAALDAVGYDGWIVVEQDMLPGMGEPGESARRNRDYLRSLGA